MEEIGNVIWTILQLESYYVWTRHLDLKGKRPKDKVSWNYLKKKVRIYHGFSFVHMQILFCICFLTIFWFNDALISLDFYKIISLILHVNWTRFLSWYEMILIKIWTNWFFFSQTKVSYWGKYMYWYYIYHQFGINWYPKLFMITLVN